MIQPMPTVQTQQSCAFASNPVLQLNQVGEQQIRRSKHADAGVARRGLFAEKNAFQFLDSSAEKRSIFVQSLVTPEENASPEHVECVSTSLPVDDLGYPVQRFLVLESKGEFNKLQREQTK